MVGWLRLCWRTTRWRVEGAEHRARLGAAPGGFIAAFWHGRIAFSPLWAVPGRRTWAVISANRDGAVMSEIAARFGIDLIRGSSRDPRKPRKDQGGRVVMVESLRALRAGDVVAIAVDGPRGPRMRAQPGVAALSAAAPAPVLPIGWATRRGPRLSSWDRFVLPLPFDRGVLIYGAPIEPPSNVRPDAVSAHLARIEATLIALSVRADREMGLTAIEPAARERAAREPGA
jgi:lysophospholipid acyltransferase (LPLAT)-like uncharacterized protein